MSKPALGEISQLGRDVLKNVGFPERMPVEFQGAQIIETHISLVLLSSEFVLKLKKPVRFHFVDQLKQRSRRQIAAKEVALNRRLSDDLYLGLVMLPFHNPQTWTGEIISRPDSETENSGEPAVLMRRIKDEQFLSDLLKREQVDMAVHIAPLAQRLATFHQQLSRSGVEPGDPREVENEIRQNLKELKERLNLLPTGSDSLLKQLERYLADRGAFAAARIAERSEQGLIVDAHGDLRAEHVVYRGAQVEAIDCLEFNDALRRTDVLNDLAFLLMDLEFQGRGDLAASLQEQYLSRYPAAGDEVLLPFYIIYRATVRAKVALLQAEQNHRSISKEAGRYLSLATRHSFSLSGPLLCITSGVMGAGKTSVAEVAEKLTAATMLRTDVIRQSLFGIEPKDKSLSFGEGKYDEDSRMKTYQAMFEQARKLLSRGNIVILDAAFPTAKLRQAAYLLAQQAKAPMVILHVAASEGVLRERLKQRTAAGKDASDGREELLEQHLRAFETPEEGEGTVLYRFDERAQGNVFRSVTDCLRALSEKLLTGLSAA